MDNVVSGALGASPEAGGWASGAEPGRLVAAAADEWPDVAVFYRQHHADLVRLALLLVGDRAFAEDVVQDVFTRLCARGRVLAQDSALAYVRAAVVNGCRSVLRRRALARRVAVTRTAAWREVQESVEHMAILAEDRRLVLAALAALPGRRREVLVLRFYLGLPVAEVAAMRLAVGAYYYPSHVNPGQEQSDQVVVINTRTSAQRSWRGGSLAGGYRFFRGASLSWTGGLRDLAVLGQWCRAADPNPGGEGCPRWERRAQLRSINPAGPPGGSVAAGRLLLRQAPRTYLAQALVSPDGSVITAMVLRGGIVGNPQISGTFPANLSIERVSAATGRPLGVIYRRYLGDTSSESGPMSNPLTLIADAAASHLILNGGICNLHCSNEFNGWLDGGRLVPLLPAGFAHREAAEAW